MTPMTVRGLPRSLQTDAWWIAADSQTGVGSGKVVVARPWWIFVLLVVMIDILVLRTSLGLGFVMAVILVAATAQWVMRAQVDRKHAAIAWFVLIVSVIPAIDVVQFLSFVMACAGLLIFAAIISGPHVLRAAVRLPFWGVGQTYRDLQAAELRGPSKSLVLDWLLPVVVGGVFLTLMIVANPLVENWISAIDFKNAPSIERILAWVFVAVLVWPMLRVTQMNLHMVNTAKPRKTSSAVYMNARSVLRALVVFNLIFAVQSVLDLGYLWGGVRLPDGMSYATYAHRGAYPLMATALLAGGFALVAQPWLDGRVMRVLLLVWVAQTLLLVISSILRLDLYVDVYGMTHLRFAAFVWMAVVALGLVVLVMQIVQHQSTSWMLTRAFGIGFVAIYMCSLVNVAGYVARHQLTVGPLDQHYVCSLEPEAAVAVARYGSGMCAGYSQRLSTPHDIRDWGFRNARLRRNLIALKAEQGA